MKTLFLLMFCSVTAISQINTFQRLYSTGFGNTIQQTADGGYILSGYRMYGTSSYSIELIKADSSGFQIWSRTYSPFSSSFSDAIQTNDGNFVVGGFKKTGGISNICLMKIGNSGNLIWEKIFEKGISIYGLSVCQTSDNGSIILGMSGVFTQKKVHLIKIDNNGNIQWGKEFSDNSPTYYISVQQTIDGGYGIQTMSKFIKINQNGDSLWATTFSYIRSFQQTIDGGYIFVGINKLIKIHQSGYQLWTKSISGTGYSIKQTIDGGYFIVGTIGLMKVSSTGDSLWARSLPGQSYSIQTTNDGGYIIVGDYRIFIGIHQPKIYSYIWSMKIDDNGECPSIMMTSRLDNETLNTGSIRKISWIKTNVNFVKIEYSTNNGGNWNLVATNIAADSCNYDWLVPDQVSQICKLKISDVNNPSVFDQNHGIFSIFNLFGRCNYIAANQVKMWIGNDGMGSNDPLTYKGGFYWPGGESATQSAIFQDGLVWGGVVSGQIRLNANTYRQGLQPGKIIGNIADDPGNPIYRIWKIRKGWENLPPGPFRDSLEHHYNNWPGELGAPFIDVNGDGIFTCGIDLPKYYGTETLWYVANDLDTFKTKYTYGSLPIGLEFQTTVYGYDTLNALADVVFKKYKIINKSSNIIDSMYLGYWSDPDLGDLNDDYTGCDSLIHLGYVYNGTNNDLIYGTPPPAVGYVLVQGPITSSNPTDSAMFDGRWIKGKRNLPMAAFTFYINPHSTYRDPSQGIYQGTLEFYNYLNGYVWNGNPFLVPGTSTLTKYVISGDPVSGTGWYEGPGWPGGPAPGDRRHLMSSGPFTIAPGDTQEIVIAIVIARGTSNINSISELKQKSQFVKSFYSSNLITGMEDIEEVPKEFSLLQNYPNPFNPKTIINYQLPVNSYVTLKIFDVLGREVATLVDEFQEAGYKSVEFDVNSRNGGLPSGVYIYRLNAGNLNISRKMMLIK